VVHENRGLHPCIQDVTRRLGKAGFLALAPDGLTGAGGCPGTDEQDKELQATVDPANLMNDFFAVIEFLRQNSRSTGRVGIIRFCHGGGAAIAAAVACPELAAAVAFYGRQPEAVDVPKIKAAVQLPYGSLDKRVNAGWPACQAALNTAGIRYKAYVCDGANHGFHNDTTPPP